MWSQQYDWSTRGDEWSSMWGNAEAQWRHTIQPRINRWIPTNHLLEIAPGYGRWTQFLLNSSNEYIGVDIAQNAVDACKQRFSEYRNAKFIKNDGRSLEEVPQQWIDFVFSFDSLVHVERDDLRAYLQQLAEKLSPSGYGFLHHSNLGAYSGQGLTRWKEWRAQSVSAKSFRDDCREVGLHCISQELIPWRGSRFIDCISVIEVAKEISPALNRRISLGRLSSSDLATIVISNPYFMVEALAVRYIADIYSPNKPVILSNQEDKINTQQNVLSKFIYSARTWLTFVGAMVRNIYSSGR